MLVFFKISFNMSFLKVILIIFSLGLLKIVKKHEVKA